MTKKEALEAYNTANAALSIANEVVFNLSPSYYEAYNTIYKTPHLIYVKTKMHPERVLKVESLYNEIVNAKASVVLARAAMDEACTVYNSLS